jgi:hypothetical protein
VQAGAAARLLLNAAQQVPQMMVMACERRQWEIPSGFHVCLHITSPSPATIAFLVQVRGSVAGAGAQLLETNPWDPQSWFHSSSSCSVEWLLLWARPLELAPAAAQNLSGMTICCVSSCPLQTLMLTASFQLAASEREPLGAGSYRCSS